MGEDLRKLKTFLAKYNGTRKVYQEMANRITGMETKLALEKNGFLLSFGFAWELLCFAIPMGILSAICFFGFFYEIVGIESNLIAWITLILLVGVPIGILIQSGKKKLKKVEKLKVEKAKIEKEYTAKLAKIYNSTNKAVAFRYASPFIVDQLIDYIECGRADTLKECLNLFEQERVQFEQTALLKSIHKNSRITAAAADYLAYHTFMESISR
ncbi:hypothetical protein [Butyrivibrio sp. WCD2001]|uniref:hypothetical protein n=1 Tax=Butyrivibrio sp. WCD2001 TaxID=1280681 RepID=UPI000418386E|nr:hypothetical protein [Butyrivibrio sp. WCD2001]